MDAVPISQFKARCLAILAEVKRSGRPVLVTRFGEPVAEVVPPSGKRFAGEAPPRHPHLDLERRQPDPPVKEGHDSPLLGKERTLALPGPRLGSLKLDRPAAVWAEAALEAPGFLRDAPLTREIAIESRRVPLAHQDPADRFIAATAVVNGLTLVTADERLLGVRGLPTLANL